MFCDLEMLVKCQASGNENDKQQSGNDLAIFSFLLSLHVLKGLAEIYGVLARCIVGGWLVKVSIDVVRQNGFASL